MDSLKHSVKKKLGTGTSHTLDTSLKAVVTERVETGQCPGLSVVIQTDWTGQLLLEISKSLASYSCGHFLCH